MRNALLACALAVAPVLSASAEADQSVLTYHGSLDRAGRYVVPGLSYERARGLHLDASFRATFRGEVYAQPLFWRPPGSGAGVLIVATEEDEVYALDAKSGAEVWKRTLGEPVPRSALPCGNISPLGVTGAPVIDEARATLYLDAAVMRANGPRHEIYALSLADGSIEPGWPLDVATALSGSFVASIAEPARRAGGVCRARSSFRSAGIGAIAAPITGLLSAFPKASRARPRASRRRREAAAYGRRAASPAMESRSSRRPATLSARAVGVMAKPSCASAPTLPARTTRTTISPRQTGAFSIFRTSTSAEPRRSRSMSQARTAPGS